MPTFIQHTFYSVTPEWPCELGGKTRYVNSEELRNGQAYFRKVDNIEIFFNSIPEDDFVQCESCYMVTERLAHAIKDAHLTGVRFEAANVFKSDMFKAYYPGKRVPRNYELMIPTGDMKFSNYHLPTSWSGDDVCLASYPDVDLTPPGPINVQHWLIVSDKFYKLLEGFRFGNWRKLERVLYTDIKK